MYFRLSQLLRVRGEMLFSCLRGCVQAVFDDFGRTLADFIVLSLKYAEQRFHYCESLLQLESIYCCDSNVPIRISIKPAVERTKFCPTFSSFDCRHTNILFSVVE